MLTYLATICLGTFVGVYALSAFAPVSVARDYYRRSWYLGVLFLAVAYLQKTTVTPSIIKAAGPSTMNLILLLVASLITSFIAAMTMARREAERVEGAEGAEGR